MRTKEQIIQEYAMGMLLPGELLCQLKQYYPSLNAMQVMRTVNLILKQEALENI